MRVTLAAVIALTCVPLTTSAQGGGAEPMHTVTIEAGDLKVIVGDDTDHGAGKAGYEGLWRLSHVQRPENIYVDRYAGLIAHRRPCTVTAVGDNAAEIRREDSNAGELFEVKAPHYVDYTVRLMPAGTVAYWNTASYMNAPEDPAIYLITTEGEWMRHYSPEHGTEASVAPASMTEFPPLNKVENARYAHGTNSFADSFSGLTFDPERALYYGRMDEMVLIYMFERGDWVIPYMSPSGGGYNRELDRKNPAWDFRYYMTGLTPGEEVAVRHRVVYKPFVSNEDVLVEYDRWKEELAGSGH